MAAIVTSAEQHPIKPSRRIQPMNTLKVADAVDQFAARKGESRRIQILRPFGVYSRNTYSAVVTPPMGPAYLASLLEAAGYPVGIIDAQGESIHRFTHSDNGRYKLQGLSTGDIIERISPDTAILGISLMFSQEWPEHRRLISQIKNSFPDLILIAGGEHATAMPEYVLRSCPAIDYVVSGEGELTFLELVAGLFSGQSREVIRGTSHIDQDGTHVHGGLSRRIEDVDNLPYPAWDLCSIEEYFIPNWSMGIGHGRNMPILATRGCPYQCTFCSNPFMWTTRYQMRDVTQVIDEIEFLVDKYEANSIDFFDLTAIVKKNWIIEFCNELQRRKLNLTWQLPSGTRSEALDDETLQAIYDQGCSFLVYAPESANQNTLDAIKKRLKIENLIKSVRSALKIGHTVKINLIIGFPDETRTGILQTILFCLRMAIRGVHDCNIATFTPYPGSELFQELSEQGHIPELNDQYFDDLLIQFDFTILKSFCRAVSGLELGLYRVLGMGLFYTLVYVLRPARLFRALKGAISGDFAPGNLFEQRVFDFFVRNRLSR